ncbi:hypothetical protein JX266_007681 [Neoarthrinium moseri]|nr:hypothetical protein JX266_007681 [Neoarthrinium moseri]
MALVYALALCLRVTELVQQPSSARNICQRAFGIGHQHPLLHHDLRLSVLFAINCLLNECWVNCKKILQVPARLSSAALVIPTYGNGSYPDRVDVIKEWPSSPSNHSGVVSSKVPTRIREDGNNEIEWGFQIRMNAEDVDPDDIVVWFKLGLDADQIPEEVQRDGTVDLISYTIKSLAPLLEVSVTSPGSGLGEEDGFDNDIVHRAQERLNSLIKRQFAMSSLPHGSWTFPCALATNKELGIRAGCMTVKATDIYIIYESVITQIVKLVNDQIGAADVPVYAIILVGGFGSSMHLQQRLKLAFSDRSGMKVLQSIHAWEAVVRGAVFKGLAQVNPQRSTVIKTRDQAARKDYGTELSLTYDHSIHQSILNKRYWDGYDGHFRVDAVEWFIKRDGYMYYGLDCDIEALYGSASISYTLVHKGVRYKTVNAAHKVEWHHDYNCSEYDGFVADHVNFRSPDWILISLVDLTCRRTLDISQPIGVAFRPELQFRAKPNGYWPGSVLSLRDDTPMFALWHTISRHKAIDRHIYLVLDTGCGFPIRQVSRAKTLLLKKRQMGPKNSHASENHLAWSAGFLCPTFDFLSTSNSHSQQIVLGQIPDLTRNRYVKSLSQAQLGNINICGVGWMHPLAVTACLLFENPWIGKILICCSTHREVANVAVAVDHTAKFSINQYNYSQREAVRKPYYTIVRAHKHEVEVDQVIKMIEHHGKDRSCWVNRGDITQEWLTGHELSAAVWVLRVIGYRGDQGQRLSWSLTSYDSPILLDIRQRFLVDRSSSYVRDAIFENIAWRSLSEQHEKAVIVWEKQYTQGQAALADIPAKPVRIIGKLIKEIIFEAALALCATPGGATSDGLIDFTLGVTKATLIGDAGRLTVSELITVWHDARPLVQAGSFLVKLYVNTLTEKEKNGKNYVNMFAQCLYQSSLEKFVKLGFPSFPAERFD